jgi:hypothetical protein
MVGGAGFATRLCGSDVAGILASTIVPCKGLSGSVPDRHHCAPGAQGGSSRTAADYTVVRQIDEILIEN